MTRLIRCILVLALCALPGFAQVIIGHHGRITRPQRWSPAYVEEHSVSVKITDGIAQTTVKQVFRNPNARPLEGSYLFALPENAALGNFAMSMGGKMVQGEVLEKDKAAQIYQSIVARQKDPGLLEYVGRRAFRARIFPIPARGTTTIEISFAETLEARDRLIEYRYPFKTHNFCHQLLKRGTVSIEIDSQEPIRAVYSPSHEVQVTKTGDHKAQISWEATKYKADRDFVALYSTSHDRVGATLFAHEEKSGEGAFLLLLAPSEDKGKVVDKDVVFVVDTSGSMAGDKIEQTRRALKYCVNSLREKDRFEIISFATEPVPLFNSLAEANPDNRKKALAHIQDLKAVGGTNINDALLGALRLTRSKDRPFMVIFLTDGEPTIGTTDTQEILRNVKKANEALTRLFVFGVGDQVRTQLLDLLAENNHGARDYVGNREDIEVKISSFFQKVSNPVLSQVKLSFEGVATSDLYPKPLPDLFRGSQLLVTGRYHDAKDAKVILEGQIDGAQVRQSFPVKFQTRKTTAFVPRLWAVRKVGYLMDQIRLNGQRKELKNEIVRLGKRYGIVTPYTSYLVMEDSPIASTGSRRGLRPNRPTRKGGRGGFYNGPASGGLPSSQRPRTRAVDLLLTKGKAKKNGTPVTGGGGGGSKTPGSVAGNSPGRALKPKPTKTWSKDAPEEEREQEKSKAALKFKRQYRDSVTISKSLKKLREARRNSGTGVLVKRVGNRTFYLRDGNYVEASVLDASEKELKAQLITIEAFTAKYFELIKTNPELAPILALGNHLLFRNAKSIIRIIPPTPAKAPLPAKK